MRKTRVPPRRHLRLRRWVSVRAAKVPMKMKMKMMVMMMVIVMVVMMVMVMTTMMKKVKMEMKMKMYGRSFRMRQGGGLDRGDGRDRHR